ncbi:hypothetical protein VTO58DRAFT_102750 [Aureobasidium pullulans]
MVTTRSARLSAAASQQEDDPPEHPDERPNKAPARGPNKRRRKPTVPRRSDEVADHTDDDDHDDGYDVDARRKSKRKRPKLSKDDSFVDLEETQQPQRQGETSGDEKVDETPEPTVTPAERILNPLDFVPDQRYLNYHRLVNAVNAGLALRPGAREDYSPRPSGLLHVLALGVHDDRDWQVEEDNVALVTIDRPPTRLPGTESDTAEGNSDGSEQTKVWKMTLFDKNHPDASRIVPFWLHPRGIRKSFGKNRNPGPYPIPQDGCLELSVCPTREEAIRLGRILCRVLNRIPGDLSLELWSHPHKLFRRVQSFAEIASFLEWKHDMDFRQLSRLWIRHGTTKGESGVYGLPLAAKKEGRGRATGMCARMPPQLCYATDFACATDMRVQPREVNTTAVDDLPHISAGFWFHGTYQPSTIIDTRRTDIAGAKVLEHIAHSVTGKVGTVDQLKKTFSDIRSSLRKQAQGAQLGFRTGSFNNDKFLYVRHRKMATTGVSMALSAAVRAVLSIPGTAALTNIEAIRNAMDSLFQIHVDSANRILQAYVYQQALNALAAGQGVLNALQAAAIAADQVNIGLITEEAAKAVHCLCEEEDRDTTEHACQQCQEPELCREMVYDEHGRLLCKGCAPKSASLHDTRTRDIRSIVQGLIRASKHTDELVTELQTKWTVGGMMKQLEKQFVDSDTWQDAFGPPASLREAIYKGSTSQTSHGRTHRKFHPYRPSIDQRDVVHLGIRRVYLHHPMNVHLTRQCINLLRGRDILPLLPQLKRAQSLAEQAQDLPPVRGYHPQFQNDWEAFERAADNAYMIRGLWPFTKDGRLNRFAIPRHRKLFLETILPQTRSGVWRGTKTTAEMQMSRANTYAYKDDFPRENRLEFDPPSANDRTYVSDFIDQIENSDTFNPLRPDGTRLRIPRNADGSPWPFREDIRPQDADLDFLFREFRARLWSMDEVCDAANETETYESPYTMLFEYVVQWFENGGKCPMFGFMMVPFPGHPQVWSFGRARFRRTADGSRGSLIEPGEVMRTGFRVLRPTNIHGDYDYTRRTVVVESWKANSMRWRYSPEDETEQLLIDAIKGIPDSTPWYDSPKPKGSYAEVHFPSFWRYPTKPSAVNVPDDQQTIIQTEDGRNETADDELLHRADVRDGTITDNDAMVPDAEDTDDGNDSGPDFDYDADIAPGAKLHHGGSGGKAGEAAAGTGTNQGQGGAQSGQQGQGNGNHVPPTSPPTSTIIPMTFNRAFLVAVLQDRDDSDPSRSYQILNPTIRINAVGTWVWLESHIDAPAAAAAGFSTPEEVAEARYLGLLPTGFTSPSVVFQVERQYLNPTPGSPPAGFGHWRFLSDGPGSVAEEAAMNYGGNVDIGFEYIPAPSAAEIWEVRQDFAAHGDRYSEERRYFAQEIDLVWVPAVSIGQQRIQQARDLQRTTAENQRYFAEAIARQNRDRVRIAEERAIAAERRGSRRTASETTSEFNRRRNLLALNMNSMIDRRLPAFQLPAPEHKNTREPEIDTDTLTKLITRQNFDTDVRDAVTVDHLAYNLVISFGRAPNDQIGYPTQNMTFVTAEGTIVGTYNDDGNVWDNNHNYIGTLMNMDVD